jgi:hypothetical protein
MPRSFGSDETTLAKLMPSGGGIHHINSICVLTDAVSALKADLEALDDAINDKSDEVAA